MNNDRILPDRLKSDAILEALLEVRFDPPATAVPEILFGRLADEPSWRGYEQRNLPASNLPAPIRLADENLRYAPIFELVQPKGGNQIIRIGPLVLSCHLRAPYGGWSTFRPFLENAVTALFRVVSGVTIRRLGLRYINALTSGKHGIASIPDLNAHIRIAGDTIGANVNLNYIKQFAPDATGIIRLSTKEFVQGELPPDMAVYVDIDIYTNPEFRTNDAAGVMRWVDDAHGYEKRSFFELLTAEKIAELRED